MQIITGKYRARKLLAVDAETTRPTLARVKESIFNLIQGEIEGKIVLDLFAGSGAFGAECISRGAKKVYFVDQEEKAILTIKQNTRGMSEEFEIIKNDFVNALCDFEKQKICFDLVYLDPPYASNFIIQALNLLANKNVLSKNCLIVIEHNGTFNLKSLPDCYIMAKSKKYGIAYVDILKLS